MIPVEGPETVAGCAASFTGQYLRPLLERASVRPEAVEGRSPEPRRSSRAKSRDLPVDEPDLIAVK